MGGDEFVIVVPDFPEDYSPQLERLRAAAVAAGEIVSEEPCLSMSVGVAVYPSDGRDVETLLANADKRMYQLKRQSKSEGAQKKAAGDSSASGHESDLRKLALAGTKELAPLRVESGR